MASIQTTSLFLPENFLGTSFSSLPVERQADIFSLLPERLGLLRCVCSSWKNIIEDPKLMSLQVPNVFFTINKQTSLKVASESSSLFNFVFPHFRSSLEACPSASPFHAHLTVYCNQLLKQKKTGLCIGKKNLSFLDRIEKFLKNYDHKVSHVTGVLVRFLTFFCQLNITQKVALFQKEPFFNDLKQLESKVFRKLFCLLLRLLLRNHQNLFVGQLFTNWINSEDLSKMEFNQSHLIFLLLTKLSRSEMNYVFLVYQKTSGVNQYFVQIYESCFVPVPFPTFSEYKLLKVFQTENFEFPYDLRDEEKIIQEYRHSPELVQNKTSQDLLFDFKHRLFLSYAKIRSFLIRIPLLDLSENAALLDSVFNSHNFPFSLQDQFDLIHYSKLEYFKYFSEQRNFCSNLFRRKLYMKKDPSLWFWCDQHDRLPGSHDPPLKTHSFLSKQNDSRKDSNLLEERVIFFRNVFELSKTKNFPQHHGDNIEFHDKVVDLFAQALLMNELDILVDNVLLPSPKTFEKIANCNQPFIRPNIGTCSQFHYLASRSVCNELCSYWTDNRTYFGHCETCLSRFPFEGKEEALSYLKNKKNFTYKQLVQYVVHNLAKDPQKSSFLKRSKRKYTHAFEMSPEDLKKRNERILFEKNNGLTFTDFESLFKH